MRTLALLVCLSFLTSCNTFTWKGQGSGLTAAQQQANIKDIDGLSREYENHRYFRDLARRSDGRANAFGRDLRSIQATVDRHFFNYSTMDPYVNYKTDLGVSDHTLRFILSSVVR